MQGFLHISSAFLENQQLVKLFILTPAGQEYRENSIDTMWLDELIASKAITPSLGVNEARNLRQFFVSRRM